MRTRASTTQWSGMIDCDAEWGTRLTQTQLTSMPSTKLSKLVTDWASKDIFQESGFEAYRVLVSYWTAMLTQVAEVLSVVTVALTG